ncbi:MAG: hypothetical protein ACYTGC_07685 [Planctomycetota bacterium]
MQPSLYAMSAAMWCKGRASPTIRGLARALALRPRHVCRGMTAVWIVWIAYMRWLGRHAGDRDIGVME